MISRGSSRLTARPMASALRAMPGPLVVVTARWPPYAAPMAAPMPAISSSACRVRTPNALCFDSSWRMSEAGVIGYEPRKSGRCESCEAAISPQASAVFPLMFVYVPGGRGAGRTS